MVVYCLGDRARGRCAGELEVELVFRGSRCPRRRRSPPPEPPRAVPGSRAPGSRAGRSGPTAGPLFVFNRS